MRQAYLILAHAGPDQLERLLDRLLPQGTPDSAILHLDASAPIWAMRARFAGHRSSAVQVIADPVAVRWGHHSIMQATAKLLAAAMETPFDIAHHISGADWPVLPHDRLVASIAAEGLDKARIAIVGAVQTERMQTWWLDDRLIGPGARSSDLRIRSAQLLRAASHGITGLAAAAGQRRSELYDQPWLKGWQWWSLPRDIVGAARAELDALLRSGRLRFTKCSDEHVIPTVVGRRFADRIVPYRRFIRWPEGDSSPAVLTRADLPMIRASNAWFARKIDLAADNFALTELG